MRSGELLVLEQSSVAGDAPAGSTDPAGLVAALKYKPGWTFKVAGPGNRYLCVFATTPDSHAPARARCTQHQFEIPTSVLAAGARAFYRWALDRLLLAEQHEACEFFEVDGRRPFYPHHQDEGSPYELVDRWELPDGPT